MSIQLNPEQEQVVGQAIRAGLIRAHDDVVEVGVASIRQRLKLRHAAANPPDVEEWFHELTAWSESHATTPLLPDEAVDRDSIYGARGL
ncbi:MAG TPA: hypothetical protein VME23_12670 [Terracidiphilus sp.]|nr:hypothetical protein [Terracidiphilus sp.]